MNSERSEHSKYISARRLYDYGRGFAKTLVEASPRMEHDQVLVDITNARATLALLIAAHNEELVIAQTINSAIRAGMRPQDIYVVDDNSSDKTSKIVKDLLGPSNIVKVKRSGKGLALTKAAKKFKLTTRYQWIHIADADGGFASNYFAEFKDKLDPVYIAATGYVRSLPGSSISQYRVVEYTIGMEIHRRFQALTGTITVIPGPTSCFRADIFSKLNFANQSITEDFDVTLQIHRNKLGKIQFIPDAVAYTQDPRNLQDFTKQITRWNRGVLQSMQRHRIGLKPTRVDAYLTYQVMQNFLLFFNYGVVLPYFAITRHALDIIAMTFLLDVLLTFMITVLAASKARRGDVLSAFPQIYLYRWVTLYVFMRAFVEVIILRKFQTSRGVWGTAGRRYASPVSV